MRRPIPGFPGYQVDADGTVYSLAGEPMSPWVSAGYLTVGLRRDGATHRIHVHRLVLMAFVGPPPLDADGCHNDGDRLNNKLSNLRWATRSENILDQVRHGRHNNARKTHCKRGHRFTVQNTYTLRGGRRQCVTCTKAHAVRSYRRRKLAEANKEN